MNNPIDKYQYSYGSGLINPFATTTSCVTEDYYTVCRYLPKGVGSVDVGREDYVLLGDSDGVVLSRDLTRVCVWIQSWPEISLSFDSSVEDMGINAYNAHEYRWYWDSDHPDAFISFQVVEEARQRDSFIKYCIIIDVCDAPPLLRGGGITVTVGTGLVQESFGVAVQQTWVD